MSIRIRHSAQHLSTWTAAHLLTVVAAVVVFLRADDVVDDRGSDSSEKAIMIALGVTIGGIVVAAATVLINNLTAKF